jgi:hypothetical protein
MRRFITKSDVDALADSGVDVLEVDDVVTVTDIAREHARERGVRIVRVPGGPAVNGDGEPTPALVRAAVRRAVIAQLGTEPNNLDAVIDRIMTRARDGG